MSNTQIFCVAFYKKQEIFPEGLFYRTINVNTQAFFVKTGSQAEKKYTAKNTIDAKQPDINTHKRITMI